MQYFKTFRVSAEGDAPVYNESMVGAAGMSSISSIFNGNTFYFLKTEHKDAFDKVKSMPMKIFLILHSSTIFRSQLSTFHNMEAFVRGEYAQSFVQATLGFAIYLPISYQADAWV